MANHRAGGFTVLESSRPAAIAWVHFLKNDGPDTALSRPFRTIRKEVPMIRSNVYA
jgi:hypothetical protein